MVKMENQLVKDQLYESQETEHDITKQTDVQITPRNIFSAPITIQDSSRSAVERS